MAPLQPSEEETLAARVVVAVTGGAFRHHDAGQAPKLPDFIVTRGDGTEFALEVSRMTGQEGMATAARLGEPWALSSCSDSWTLVVTPGSLDRLGRIRETVGALLGDFESRGGELFSRTVSGSEEDPAVTADMRREMVGLGIEIAIRRLAAGQPPVAQGVLSQGGSYPAFSVLGNAAVEKEAHQNAAKLDESPYLEGHLFLWLDFLSEAWPAFVADSVHTSGALAPVSAPPVLPPGVDQLWVAYWPKLLKTRAGHTVLPDWAAVDPGEPKSLDAVWRVHPPKPWRVDRNVQLGQ